jgi:carotenoid cleavage dioxygenase-like enzyme
MTESRFKAGFETLLSESDGETLAWQGEAPPWLAGDLLRTGPAMFEIGAKSYRHWFDGLAMLHRFALTPQGVRYSNRFLHGKTFNTATSSRKVTRGEFATNSQDYYWTRVLATFAGNTTDNGNVNVVAYGDETFVALTEVPNPVQFDRDTLDTVEAFTFGDELKSHVTTAHPHYDRERRLIYNCDIMFHRPSVYRFTRMDFGGTERKTVTEIPVDRPSYMHSFGMSENYLILVEFPLVTNPITLLLSGRPFIETYRWRPDRGLRFTVVDKDTGKIVRQVTTDACFGFHLVNAFEADGAVMIDMVAYADAGILKAFYLDSLRHGGGVVTGTLTRFTIPLDQGAVQRVTLSAVKLELPYIDYKRRAGQRYQYLWAAGQAANGFMDRLQKYDLQSCAVQYWSEPGCYPGEPVFVAAPSAMDEDDGVILSVVLDTARRQSCLLVLDAATLTERARSWLPHVIPFGFHGSHHEASVSLRAQ